VDWRGVADSVKPNNGKAKGCGFGKWLATRPDGEREQLRQVIDEAVRDIALHDGRWTYIRDVVVAGGGPAFDTQCISRHVRGLDTCRTS